MDDGSNFFNYKKAILTKAINFISIQIIETKWKLVQKKTENSNTIFLHYYCKG